MVTPDTNLAPRGHYTETKRWLEVLGGGGYRVPGRNRKVLKLLLNRVCGSGRVCKVTQLQGFQPPWQLVWDACLFIRLWTHAQTPPRRHTELCEHTLCKHPRHA